MFSEFPWKKNFAPENGGRADTPPPPLSPFLYGLVNGILRINNTKFSAYNLYMDTNIWGNF